MAQSPGIVTPEAVVLEFETAGLGSRLLAGMLDALVMGAALLALGTAFTALATAADGAIPGWLGITLVLLLVSAVLFGYPTAMETLWRGRTLGKAALGLRVVTVEGTPVRFRHAAIRAALGLVDFYLLFGAPVIAVLSILVTRRNQRLGDLVAGTLVLRERTGVRMPTAVGFSVPPGLEPYAATIDVSALTPADYATVRSFLVRAPELEPAIRARLAHDLAVPLAARLRHTPDPRVGPEWFLVCVAALYQRRWGGPAGAADAVR